DLDLAAKTLVVDARGEFGRQHLDDDLAAQRRVRRDEDATHAATGQLTLERVARREGGLELGGEFGHGGMRVDDSVPTARPGREVRGVGYAMRRAAASCIARLALHAQIAFGTSGNCSANAGGPNSTATTGRRAAFAAAH